MASSRKSPPVDPGNGTAAIGAVDTALGAALAECVKEGASVAIALSGGVDSIVLLDSLARLAPRHSITLSAVHINHGLSPNAQAWAEFCAAQCAQRGLPFALHRLQVARERSRSLEALARSARYERLLAEDVDVVALAHHADDQAETVLLQLLRGAGPHGLAAMPAYRPGRPALLRPLLDLPRAEILACAKARRLAWIEDESNANRAHARNALRHDIAPLLAARFAGYPRTLARSARHQAEAAELLDELARSDAEGAIDATGLDSARLRTLSGARARNLLRWFLRAQGLRTPSEARLADMLRQLVDAAADARTRIVLDDVEIGRHRGRIAVHAAAVASFERIWDGESEVRLPGGVLAFTRSQGAGLAAAKLESAQVTLRSRCGGERICLAANRPTHAVKKLLQDARMPHWERESLPLVWSGDELAAVPGVGVALAFQASPGEAGWIVDWRPDIPARGRMHTD
jgi:tRNA(Ile)-lysidine synthase